MRLKPLLIGFVFALLGFATQAQLSGSNASAQIERLIRLNSKAKASDTPSMITSDNLQKKKSYDELLPTDPTLPAKVSKTKSTK